MQRRRLQSAQTIENGGDDELSTPWLAEEIINSSSGTQFKGKQLNVGPTTQAKEKEKARRVAAETLSSGKAM